MNYIKIFRLSFLLLLFSGYEASFGLNTKYIEVKAKSLVEQINGVVKDEDGNTLQGVTITVQNTQVTTMTDENGEFTIDVESGKNLIFSSVGYVSKTIKYEEGNFINVVMKKSSIELDEIVAIGYGSIKRKDLTGSVSTIKGSDLRDRNSENALTAMQGLAPGVRITSGGLPGQAAHIEIRGIGSLTNNNPLFVIDGLIGDLAHLNPADIESIQILKDASSAAIYGSRAANGVVIVTTKKGNDGPLKVHADINLTAEWLPRYDLMDAETWKKFDDLAYDNAIQAGVSGVNSRQTHYDASTDWQGRMLKTGILQNYNVSLSGGSRTGNYYVSLNRQKDEGALYHTGYDRYGVRVNTSGQKGIFSYGENFYYTHTERTNLNGNPWSDFIAISPTIPVLDPSHPGGFGYGDPDRANNYGRNLIAMQDLFLQDNPEDILEGNLYGEIKFFNMIKAKLSFGYINYNGITNTLRKEGNWTMGQGAAIPYITFDNGRNTQITIDQTYSFNQRFGKHDVEALGGISYAPTKTNSNFITKLEPLRNGDDYITSLSSATGTTTAGGSYTKTRLLSYFGRLNYTYDDRYIFQGTFRRDGTSRLPVNTRWGNFASFSVGWRISNESFFNIPFINDLKLRGNYGTLGNSSIGPWDYQAVINTAPRAVLGPDDKVYVGETQSQLTNNDLVWERKKTTNVGFDAIMADNRLTVNFDYFENVSKDLLVNLPVLMSTGNEGGAPAVNAGSLQNRGVELNVRWNQYITDDFSYFVSANFARVKNKILDLGYGRTVYYEFLSRAEIGQPLGMFYLYKMLGIFQNTAEIQGHTNSSGTIIQPDALPGDIIYDDYNDDGIISSEDRQILGNPWPKLEMGLSFGASFKGIDLSVNGYGRFKYDVWNGAMAAAADFANNQNNFNGISPWTPDNPVDDRPRIVFGDTRNSRGDQDRWLEDGSFFRIREITVGYTIPEKITDKTKLRNVRLGASLKNLITLTGYNGLDPEFRDGGIFTRGTDNTSFPNPRSILFTFSFDF